MLASLEGDTLATRRTLPKAPDVRKSSRKNPRARRNLPAIALRAARTHQRLGAHLIRDLSQALGALERSAAQLSVVLVGDQRMRRLNRQARGVDRTTDVLSFPAAKTPGSRLLGDLVLSVPVARRRAATLDRPLRAELRLYAIHGLLHLLGYDHQTSADLRRMARKERALLGESGLVDRSMTIEAPA
jgi:probable rRNA maturation factor